ncbi:beta-galactosidase trimerization domain-containing protein [Streptomyces pseudoechinosporeus]
MQQADAVAIDARRRLRPAGIACDVVPPDHDLSGYRLVIVPSLYLLKDQDAERLTEFVRGGGHPLVSFFSGIVDEHVQATVREGDGGRFVFSLNRGQEEAGIRLPEPMTDALTRGTTPAGRLALPAAGVAVLIEP